MWSPRLERRLQSCLLAQVWVLQVALLKLPLPSQLHSARRRPTRPRPPESAQAPLRPRPARGRFPWPRHFPLGRQIVGDHILPPLLLPSGPGGLFPRP